MNKTFVAQPQINSKRSQWTQAHNHLTTFSAGKLIPIYRAEYMPGDTFSMDMSFLCRMATPIHPVMGDAYIDVYFFACPNRLVWEHFKEFMGESPEDPYLSQQDYLVPHVFPQPSSAYPVPFKSVADYMGVPAGEIPKSYSALPFRAYGLIWNEWFRDQNLQNAIDVDTSDADAFYPYQVHADGDDFIHTAAIGGSLAPVNKFHDLFTSATIEAQKGEPVAIPLSGFAPVYASNLVNLDDLDSAFNFQQEGVQTNARIVGVRELNTVQNSALVSTTVPGAGTYPAQLNNVLADLGAAQRASQIAGVDYSTINDLRYAFAVSKLLETDNNYGTRYFEQIKGHFNVEAPDTLVQRPQFLGHKRVLIGMNQVVQTSSTDGTTPQGNLAAYSHTSDKSHYFTYSAVEHGWIIGLACVRTKHVYSQGLEKCFARREKLDFYFPELSNLPNQPIKRSEIYNGTLPDPDGQGVIYDPNNDSYFGFAEAWYDYRYATDRISGEFRTTYPQSLSSWHYGDLFTSAPYLSDEFIRETRVNIDRTLAVQSDVADQFIADFHFKVNLARVMPVTSVPGFSPRF